MATMRRTYLPLLASLLALQLALAGPAAASDAEDPAYEDFAAGVRSLDEICNYLLSCNLIYGFPLFQKIAGDGGKNVAFSLKVNTDPDFTWRQKWIARMLMCRLPSKAYAAYLLDLAALYDRNLISEIDLNGAIVPPDFTYVMVDTYWDPDVQRALRAIQARPTLSVSDREFIDYVASGRAVLSLAELRLMYYGLDHPDFDRRLKAVIGWVSAIAARGDAMLGRFLRLDGLLASSLSPR